MADRIGLKEIARLTFEPMANVSKARGKEVVEKSRAYLNASKVVLSKYAEKVADDFSNLSKEVGGGFGLFVGSVFATMAVGTEISPVFKSLGSNIEPLKQSAVTIYGLGSAFAIKFGAENLHTVYERFKEITK